MTLTMREFRELTSDVPDEWPLTLTVREGDDFTSAPADASVDLTGRCVEVANDAHVTRGATCTPWSGG